jgi:large subunit ribosomal protein L36
MSLAKIIGGVSFGLRRLINPAIPSIELKNGFKVRQYIKLRCPYCYFIRINGRMHVECRMKPRHKQREAFNVKLLW